MSMLARSNPIPLIKSSASLKSPSTLITPLVGGLRVASQTFNSEVTTIGVHINAGTRNDVKGGTANFLNKLTSRKIESQLRNFGKVSSFTDRENTVYNITIFKEDAKNVLASIQDAVLNPPLDANTIGEVRESIVKNIKDTEHNYLENIYDHLHSTAYLDSALGKPLKGTVEDVNSITVADLESYHSRNIVKKNVAVVGAGEIDHEDLIQTTVNNFSKMSAENPAQLSPSIFVGSDIQMRFDSMKNAHIALAYESVPLDDHQYFTFKVIESIIGSWRLDSIHSENSCSRLAQDLLEGGEPIEHQNAYSFDAFNFNYKDTGLFGVRLTGPARHLEEAMYHLTYNLVRLAYEVTDEEVFRAQNNLKTKYALELSQPESVVNNISKQLFSEGRRVPYYEFSDQIGLINAYEVRNVAEYFIVDEDHALAAVGALHGLPDYNWIRRRSYWNRY